MKKSPFVLIALFFLSGCSGNTPISESERVHPFVMETKVSAEVAMKAGYRFFKAKGSPKDLLIDPPKPFENRPQYQFAIIENDLYRGSNPKENAMLSEIQISGKVECASEEKRDWTYLIKHDTTDLNFNFKFEAKDQRVRLEYYGVKMTKTDGTKTFSDFTSTQNMVKTLENCMGYLHQNLVKYINSKQSNW
jgi:hypothetical protein